jgi:hypothetical protein
LGVGRPGAAAASYFPARNSETKPLVFMNGLLEFVLGRTETAFSSPVRIAAFPREMPAVPRW